MSDMHFYLTKAGRLYYDVTLPDLVRQITRIADALERSADTESVNDEHADEPETPDKEKP